MTEIIIAGAFVLAVTIYSVSNIVVAYIETTGNNDATPDAIGFDNEPAEEDADE